jgi:16S rRNA A1518/A1519 N6-dimethyltransferase RsmA/KsgA/DIM1 with predicted DNA glycosylase/AP lyase activity
VIRITPQRPFPLTEDEETDLRTLTAACFSWRRKQLQKTLRSEPRYELSGEDVEQLEARTGIDLRRRPETLSPEEFVELSRAIGRLST